MPTERSTLHLEVRNFSRITADHERAICCDIRLLICFIDLLIYDQFVMLSFSKNIKFLANAIYLKNMCIFYDEIFLYL